MGSHKLFDFLNSLFGVTVDKGLVDVQIGVKVKKYVHLPLLLFDGNVVLVNTFKSELLILDENLRWVSHEVLSHTENFVGEGGREKSNLDLTREELEDVLNLGLETTGEHLVSLVEHENLQVVGLEEPALHHVVNTAWSSNDDVGAA